LMEFLASDVGQKTYADINFEYPVNPNVAAADLVKSWGTLPRDKINLSDIAKYQKDAAQLVDAVGFNN
jgi:iron(III) transport system substrate-binding protein